MFQSGDDPALALPSPSPTVHTIRGCQRAANAGIRLRIWSSQGPRVGGEALRLELRLWSTHCGPV
jgi:hypothetical protein